MAGKKFGSLFQRLLDKSPEIAGRLREMAKGEKSEATRQNREQERKGDESRPPKNISRTPSRGVQKSNQPGEMVAEKKFAIGPKFRKQTHEQPDKGKGFFDDIPANAHQFVSGDDSSGTLDIVVGVDLGTSSTKVVVQVPYYAGLPAFAVPFNELAHNSLKYLLPTRLFIGKDGVCSLAKVSESRARTDIKIGLMEKKVSSDELASGSLHEDSPITIATAYLALVLQYTRGWFIANKKEIFGEYNLRWSCNLGLPAAIDDDHELRKNFCIAGNAAWLLSLRSPERPGGVTVNEASRAVDDIKHSRFDSDDLPQEFNLIPEVVAQVTGYARSQFRDEGLHLLVDIGASTLDVCSFILRKKEGEDYFPILTADVELLGAKNLHLTRVGGAREAVSAHVASLIDEDDPLSIIPEDARVYVPPVQEIISTEDSFKAKCNDLLYRTFVDLKVKRDPRSSRWSSTFPVFVCGGAKSMRVYQKVMSDIDEWFKQYGRSSQGIRMLNLPKPESLEAEVDDESYHRLAVAWGLSHVSFNIGEYIQPSKIEDIPPPEVPNYEDAYTSKDMV